MESCDYSLESDMRVRDQGLVPLTHYCVLSPFTSVSKFSFMYTMEHNSNYFSFLLFAVSQWNYVSDEVWGWVGRKIIGVTKIY